MNLQVAKWRNSLALRIPAEVVRSLGLKEGDSVEARLTLDGGLTIRPATRDRKAFAHELSVARKAMTMPRSSRGYSVRISSTFFTSFFHYETRSKLPTDG